MGLYRRGKTYWLTVVHNGQRIQQSTGTSNKKLAENIYAKIKMDIVEGKWFNTQTKRKSYDDLVEKYMREYAIPNKSSRSLERDKYSLKRLSEFFSGKMLCEITPQLIAEYKSYRRGSSIKPATLAKELELLRAALNIALR
ncbi:MAG: phage integrase SAM-like domain-containing protein, partial [Nitrospirae bacterium]|nr:phage integrase SAM-like domain-containing protein [Nitrospirota bacterium]